MYSSHSKQCPSCQQTIYFKTKNSLNSSIRGNKTCVDCVNKKQNAYSKEEIEFLKQNATSKTLKECATLLGRSIFSVTRKSQRLNISFNKTVNNGEFKSCSCCRKILSVEHYGKCKNSKNGIYSYCKECAKTKRNSVKDQKRNYDRLYRKKRCVTDINYKLRRVLRKRFKETIKNQYRKGLFVKALGCSVEYFKTYLESKFEKDMSWDNYGFRGWHIDHIKPCCSFDLTKTEEIEKCFHYSNLQPLWWRDNLSKGGRII
jgi:hypothetical protein